MAKLAKLNVDITGSAAKLTGAIKGAQTKLDKFKEKNKKIFKTIEKLTKGAAIGGGAALVGFTTAAIKGAVDLEKELRPAIERSRIGAESLQVLAEAAKRAGSEDGLEGIVDTAQELQLQLGELALAGNSRALPALEALGLAQQDLIDQNPEDAWRTVITAIQDYEGDIKKATLAEEIFGGTSEKIAGIVNQTSGEFASLQDNVRDTAHIMSEEGLAKARAFDEGLQKLKGVVGGVAGEMAEKLLPHLTAFADWLSNEGIPKALQFFERVKEHAKPFFEAFIRGVETIWTHGLQPFFEWLFTNEGRVKGTIAAIGAAIVLSLGPVGLAAVAITGMITLIGYMKDNFDDVKEFFKGAWQTVKDTFKAAGEFIHGIYDSHFGWILPAGPLVKGLLFLKDEWRNIWQNMKDTLRGIVNGIVDQVNRVIDQINRIPLVNIPKVPKLGPAGSVDPASLGRGSGASRLQGLASGGTVTRGGRFRVGERGPEEVFLPGRARVAPAGAGGGGNTYVFNFPNYVGSKEDLKRMMNEARLEFRQRGN